VFIAIHLDLGEAEFWQQYESANECVIATALCCLVTPRCDRPAARRLLPTLPAPAALVGAMCAYDPLLAEKGGEGKKGEGACGPTNFGS
jgi:hypothetical protein